MIRNEVKKEMYFISFKQFKTITEKLIDKQGLQKIAKVIHRDHITFDEFVIDFISVAEHLHVVEQGQLQKAFQKGVRLSSQHDPIRELFASTSAFCDYLRNHDSDTPKGDYHRKNAYSHVKRHLKEIETIYGLS